MRLFSATRRQSLDQLCQLSRRLKRSRLAIFHDRSREPSRIPLAAEFPKNLR
jgi:hypothetical protein